MNEGGVHLAGFGGRGGFGRRPTLIVVDMALSLTDPESPLGSNLDSPIDAIRKLTVGAARRAEIR
jgi:maleamate amidohydrolase